MQEDSVYTTVEEPPSFPGGEAALGKFIFTNARLPEYKADFNFDGRVIASFIVEKNGSVSNIKIEECRWGAMGREVLRVLKKYPKWKPGTQHQKAVRVTYRIPLMFEPGEL